MTAETWVLRKDGVEVARFRSRLAAEGYALIHEGASLAQGEGIWLPPGVTITREDQAHG